MFVRQIALAAVMVTAGLTGLAHAGSPSLPPAMEAALQQKFDAFTAEHGKLFERLDPDDLRHPYEKKVISALYKDQKIKDLMPEASKIVEDLNTQYHHQHLLNGVLCSETQFPEIYKLARENAAALQMKQGFKVYVLNSAQINAYTWSIDENNYGIALFSGLIRAVPMDQLKAILGHEMGHVKSRHILSTVLVQLYYKKYKALPPVFSLNADGTQDTGTKTKERAPEQSLGFTDLPPSFAGDLQRRLGFAAAEPFKLSDAESMNFTKFQQAAEYTGDRTGAVASGDRQLTLLGMVKLASGHTGELGGFDLDTYLHQIEEVLATMTNQELQDMMGTEGSHAFTLMRVGELDNFFKSPDFVQARDARKVSVFRDIMSAEFQIAGIMLETMAAQKKFFASAAAQELNALERRLKEKEFSDIIVPRQAADAVLNPLVYDTINELGLSNANAAFDIYESYARLRKSGVAIRPISEKLVERLKFELTNEQLPPAQADELKRKLKIAVELRDMRPGKPGGGAAVAGDDDDTASHIN